MKSKDVFLFLLYLLSIPLMQAQTIYTTLENANGSLELVPHFERAPLNVVFDLPLNRAFKSNFYTTCPNSLCQEPAWGATTGAEYVNSITLTPLLDNGFCVDGRRVSVEFLPFENPGVYQISLVSATGTSDGVNYTITVTDTPTPLVTLDYTADVNETLVLDNYRRHVPFITNNCGEVLVINPILGEIGYFQPVDWLTTNLLNLEIFIGDSALYTTTLMSETSGSFEAYRYFLFLEYSTQPSIQKINFLVGADCNGVVDGEAYTDACGNCVGGDTGETDCVAEPEAIACYPFLGNAADEIGSNDGVVNGATPTTGRWGFADDAYAFNGVNNTIVVESGTFSEYTISSWVKFTGSTLNKGIAVFTINNPIGSASHQIRTDASGRFLHYTFDGSGKSVTGTTILQEEVWYHVAITAKNGGVARLYVNGVQEGNPANVGTLWTGGLRFFFGSNSAGLGMPAATHLNGVIDDIKIFNTELNSIQIGQEFEKLAPCGNEIPVDCNGVIGGSAFFDNCDVCVGGNTGLTECIEDCNGVFGGTAETDACEICYENGPLNPEWNTTCADCAGIPNGPNLLDECDVCLEGGESNPLWNTACADCEGTPNGSAFLDDCEVCVGGNTGLEACVQDCNGDFGGTASIDECGSCVGGNTGLTACLEDCEGVFGGTAYLDNCDICVGGSTGVEPCEVDCNGVPGGNAVVDDCGVCRESDDPDYNTTCLDCAGIPNGNSETDLCGECLEGGASNPDWNTFCADCAGVPNGPHLLDECDVCLEGGESNPLWNTSCADCEGTPNGESTPGTACTTAAGDAGFWSDNCACIAEQTPCFIAITDLIDSGDACISNPEITLGLEVSNVPDNSVLNIEIIYESEILPEYLSFPIPNGGGSFNVDFPLIGYGLAFEIIASIENGDFGCSASVSDVYSIPECTADCEGVFGGNATPGSSCINEEGLSGIWSEECLCEVETGACLADAGAIFTNSPTSVCANSLDLVKVRFSETPNMDYKSIGLITDNSPDPLVLAYFFAQPENGFSFNEYAGNEFQIWVLNVEFPDVLLSEAAQLINNGIYPPLSTIDGLCFDLSNPIAVSKIDCELAGEVCYAMNVDDYVEGTTLSGGNIAIDRINPWNAIGAPEGTDELVFVTLGYGGSITLSFGGLLPNGAGDDLMVVETTYNNPGCGVYPEYADVYVSQNGVDFHFAKTVCKSDNTVDISDAGQGFTFITHVQIVNNDALSTTPDGYDLDGVISLHPCVTSVAGLAQVVSLPGNQTEAKLSSQPNPTNGPSVVRFELNTTDRASLELFDLSGRNIATLFNQEAQAGQEYRLNFDGTYLPNGIYIYRLTTGNEIIIEKMMIAK